MFRNIWKNDCVRELEILTRYIPNKVSALIHGLIRESHRYLYDWGCCPLLECPLVELWGQQFKTLNRDSPVVLVRTTWNRIGGPPLVRPFCREPLTIFAVGAAVLINELSEQPVAHLPALDV